MVVTAFDYTIANKLTNNFVRQAQFYDELFINNSTILFVAVFNFWEPPVGATEMLPEHVRCNVPFKLARIVKIYDFGYQQKTYAVVGTIGSASTYKGPPYTGGNFGNAPVFWGFNVTVAGSDAVPNDPTSSGVGSLYVPSDQAYWTVLPSEPMYVNDVVVKDFPTPALPVVPDAGWTSTGTGYQLHIPFTPQQWVPVVPDAVPLPPRPRPPDRYKLLPEITSTPVMNAPNGKAHLITKQSSGPIFTAFNPFPAKFLTVTASGTEGIALPVISTPRPTSRIDAVADGVDLAWALSGSSVAQDSYSVRLVAGDNANVWWWTGSAWSTTETSVPGAAQSVHLTPGPWISAQPATIMVTSYPAGANPVGRSSEPVTITPQAKPVASVSVLGRTVDSAVPDMTPDVIISGTPGAGQSLIDWEAQVVEVATGKVVSTGAGQIAGTAPVTWTVSPPLTNNVDYTARALVTQTGWQSSRWTSVPFKVVVVPPAAPLAQVAQVTAGGTADGPPGVTVVSTFNLTSGFPYTSREVRVRVQRLDGDVWRDLAGELWDDLPVMPSTTGRVDVVDYAVATAGAVRYRSRGESSVDGTTLISDWSEVIFAGLVGDHSGWLVDPFEPSLAVRVRVSHRAPDKVDTGSKSYDLLDRPDALVSHRLGGRVRSALSMTTYSNAERRALSDLLISGRRLLLRGRPTQALTETGSVMEAAEDLWLMIEGDMTRELAWQGPTSMRTIAVPIVVLSGQG